MLATEVAPIAGMGSNGEEPRVNELDAFVKFQKNDNRLPYSNCRSQLFVKIIEVDKTL